MWQALSIYSRLDMIAAAWIDQEMASVIVLRPS
jgi:hypothetical protein